MTKTDFITAYNIGHSDGKDGVYCPINEYDVMFGIDKLQSVTPKPKTGHWIVRDTWLDFIREECSICGKVYSHGKNVVFNFCPNCGKRMYYESFAEKEDIEENKE